GGSASRSVAVPIRSDLGFSSPAHHALIGVRLDFTSQEFERSRDSRATHLLSVPITDHRARIRACRSRYPPGRAFLPPLSGPKAIHLFKKGHDVQFPAAVFGRIVAA